MENKEAKRITTPEEAVHALALAAYTARQIFCIDEPPLPTLLSKMTWSAEEIALWYDLPQCMINCFYLIVFSEHPFVETPTLTQQELRDTQAALTDFLGEDEGERIWEGILEWDELLDAAETEDAA